MYNGQAEQDKFVNNILKQKKNGFFVEIGSHHPINTNNTYLLESHYNYKGIMIEQDPSFLPLYKTHRNNSIHIIHDATKIDYNKLFTFYNVPLEIDYLQVDLEVDNGSTIVTLLKLDQEIFDKYKFATITFEHDIYHSNFRETRKVSREIFKKRGYFCVFEDIFNLGGIGPCPYEDWYVHPDLVDMEYVIKLKEYNEKFYINHKITGKTINWNSIEYNF